jgi:hypothetical protein
VPVYPGVNTPSLVEAALEKGLSVLKFFPAEVCGGTKMLKALSGPFPTVRFMATGGVREVHTNIICSPAKQLFEQQGILVFATEEVPMILNRDRSSMCPIDTQIAEIESIEECVAILQARFAH